MKFFKSLYITNRFIWALVALSACYALGYSATIFVTIGHGFLLFLLIGWVIELLMLYKNRVLIIGKREVTDKLSNGDENPVYIHLQNKVQLKLNLLIIDDIPDQFQARNIQFKYTLDSQKETTLSYHLRPTKRGAYTFGDLHIYCSTVLGFFRRRQITPAGKEVAVFPSLIQLKKHELLAISNNLKDYGIKKIRRIDQSTDFEQIRNYVNGDNYRVINWKATARSNRLMVNQYQDERSQDVYCIVNLGRTMKMPFEGLSLLDYSINSTLVMLSTALNKGDKAGLITFDSHVRAMVKANNKNNQLFKVLNNLYAQSSDYKEPNYRKLYTFANTMIKKRSLIFFYTNIEGRESLNRIKAELTVLSKKHVVVVVFFKNSELNDMVNEKPKKLDQVYVQTIARKLEYDKEQIVLELRKHGIHSVLTEPKNLTVDSVNKYLELKARSII